MFDDDVAVTVTVSQPTPVTITGSVTVVPSPLKKLSTLNAATLMLPPTAGGVSGRGA